MLETSAGATPLPGEPSLQAIRVSLTARPAMMAVKDIAFVIRLAEQIAIAGAGGWLALGAHGPLLSIAGIGLIGAAFARNLELMHECMHFLAFRSRRANRFFGILLGLPMLTSFEEWRYSHQKHHADVRNEGFQFKLEEINGLFELFSHFLMLEHYRDAFAKIYLAIRGEVDAPPPIRAAVNRDYRIMLGAITTAALSSVIFETSAFVLVWLLPLAVAGIVNFHIQLPEHYQCDTATNDALRNSRTIEASRLAAWFVNNNNFHTSHHWMPSAPIRHLAAIDAEIHKFIQTTGETYPRFYRNYYARLWKNFCEA